MTVSLTAENVQSTCKHCLFRDAEIYGDKVPEKAVRAEVVMRKFAFHPERLESMRDTVQAMLAELPEQFQQSGGGGWSFLQACQRKDGVQWGEHRDIDSLLSLGIALGLVHFQLPREMWSVLPGGLPYFVVVDGSAAT